MHEEVVEAVVLELLEGFGGRASLFQIRFSLWRLRKPMAACENAIKRLVERGDVTLTENEEGIQFLEV